MTHAKGNEAEKPKSFKDALARLDEIVRRIESGEVELEESVQRYEEGMALIRHCRIILAQAEQRIKQLQSEDDSPAQAE